MLTSAAGKPYVSLGEVETPLGCMIIASSDSGLVGLSLPGQERGPFLDALRRRWSFESKRTAATAIAEQAAAELAAYFDGCLCGFSVPLAPPGTPFQQQAWRAVCAVPYGATRSYGAVAAALGRPHAARAVGHANGTNPLPIVIPCHRLVGSNGDLIRFGRSGGGLEMKRWLIAHERRHAMELR